MKCNQIKSEDIPMIEDWYTKYNQTMPPLDFFPGDGTGGFIVYSDDTPIAALWLWYTNSKTAIPAVVIADKDYREDNRSDALQFLIDYTTDFAEQQGFRYAMSWAKKGVLLEKYEKAGFFKDEKPSHELIKYYQWEK